MPPLSTKAAEMMSYDAVRVTSFTQIHERPTRHNYKALKKEASDLASKANNITFTWSCDQARAEEY